MESKSSEEERYGAFDAFHDVSMYAIGQRDAWAIILKRLETMIAQLPKEEEQEPREV